MYTCIYRAYNIVMLPVPSCRAHRYMDALNEGEEPLKLEASLLKQIDYAANLKLNGPRRQVVLEGGRTVADFPLWPQG